MLQTDIHLESLRATVKKVLNGRKNVMMTYIESGFKNSRQSTIDWL